MIEHRILSTSFSVQASQHLWLALIDEVYQFFTSVLHTSIARSQPRDARRIEILYCYMAVLYDFLATIAISVESGVKVLPATSEYTSSILKPCS